MTIIKPELNILTGRQQGYSSQFTLSVRMVKNPSRRNTCFRSIHVRDTTNRRRSATVTSSQAAKGPRMNKATAPMSLRKSGSLQTTTPTASSSIMTSTRSFSLKQDITNFLHTPRLIPVPRWLSPRHFSITLSEVCGHASFLLVFFSYAVDDYLLLRFIAVAGSISVIIVSYFHPLGRPLWFPLRYNLMFIAVNSYRIWKVWFDQYRAENLGREHLRYHRVYFHNLELVDFAKLVRLGVVETFEPGEAVLHRGEWNEYLWLVLNGELSVMLDGHLTDIFREGNFISEAVSEQDL